MCHIIVIRLDFDFVGYPNNQLALSFESADLEYVQTSAVKVIGSFGCFVPATSCERVNDKRSRISRKWIVTIVQNHLLSAPQWLKLRGWERPL